MEVFECKHKIDYQGIKPDLTVTFPRMMTYILEASLLQTESSKYPMNWYASNGLGFLLTNWQVKVLAYPKWNDEIIVQTWPVFFKGVLAERSFAVWDKDKRVIAYANSGWIFTDIVKRRPVRPSQDIIDCYGQMLPPRLEKDFKITIDSECRKLSRHHFTVTRRDTDSNGHVNNIKYIEWGLDYIPDDLYDHHQVKEMKISYKKECAKGAFVIVETLQNAGKEKQFITRIRADETPEVLLAEMSTVWA